MGRGIVFSTVLARLKAELRESSAANTALDAELLHACNSRQRDLANQYDWPFLRHTWDLSLSAGTRYYDIPTTDTRGATSLTINFARPVQVYRSYAGSWEIVPYGITAEEHNVSEGTGEAQDPVQRWQIVTNVNEASNPDEVEVWPVPASSSTLRFVGQREPREIASSASYVDLDDLLLIYFVAGDYLAMRGQENAGLVLGKAQAHLMRLLASYPNRDCPPVKFGGYRHQDRTPVKLIAVAS